MFVRRGELKYIDGPKQLFRKVQYNWKNTIGKRGISQIQLRLKPLNAVLKLFFGGIHSFLTPERFVLVLQRFLYKFIVLTVAVGGRFLGLGDRWRCSMAFNVSFIR